jgi:predicted transcriptional regulator
MKHRKPLTKEQSEQVRQMVRGGMTHQAVADKLGIAQSTVSYHIMPPEKKRGILRERKTYEGDKKKRPDRICSVDGCQNKVGLGLRRLCSKHFSTGDSDQFDFGNRVPY